jgi:HD-like signal output (HDOD) protein
MTIQQAPQKPDLMIDLIEECERSGRRRIEIAAFLAREYGLEANAINRLMADHQASRAGRTAFQAVAAVVLAVTTFAHRQTQEHAEFVPLLALV